MADEPLKFPTGVDLKRQQDEMAGEVDVRVRCISLAISAASGKAWTPADLQTATDGFYKFLTKRG
jgi:hypothetical protein